MCGHERWAVSLRERSTICARVGHKTRSITNIYIENCIGRKFKSCKIFCYEVSKTFVLLNTISSTGDCRGETANACTSLSAAPPKAAELAMTVRGLHAIADEQATLPPTTPP